MKEHLNQKIKKDSQFNREYLRGLEYCPRLNAGSSVVYIYSLVEQDISYPNKQGKTLYIGESGKNTKPTGARFVTHISPEEEKGGTGGLNHCLSRYYWNNVKMRLRIFLLDSNEDRTLIERNLLQLHVKEFGSVPMCQCSTSEYYHTTELYKLDASDMLDLLAM